MTGKHTIGLCFAEKTKLPCHVIGQKVLFHGVPNEEKVGIHYNTDKYIIKVQCQYFYFFQVFCLQKQCNYDM